MNWDLVYAIIWWALMISAFIVAPVVTTRYRGSHRMPQERRHVDQ